MQSRTLITIESRYLAHSHEWIDIRVASWNPNVLVRRAIEVVPEMLRDLVHPGAVFVCWVNTDTPDDQPSDLNFVFESLAPPPLNLDLDENFHPYYRTLVDVEKRLEVDGVEYLDLCVIAWDTTTLVRRPVDILPPELRTVVKTGTLLFARVNIGVELSDNLGFREFEIAPIPRTFVVSTT